MKKVFSFLLALVLLALAGPASGEVTLRELARLEDRAPSDIIGIGFVVGLNGTGDGGDAPSVSQGMARFYANMGMPLDTIDALEDMTNVAIVYVRATLP
ncbi:MAG: flagellar basal body P-ring protein FlgI, partial [Phycisphaerales bacterium]|nr:flagellar basal body P-ring protein FlgI [Phycisphaerales bacterium]